MIFPHACPSVLTCIPVIRGNTVFIFIVLALSTVLQFGIGLEFYLGAYNSLRNRAANMDVLIVLGTSAAWGYGVILMCIGLSP